MFSNIRITGFVILLLLLVIMCSSDKGNTPPVDEPDETSRVWIDTVDALPGEQARVEILADLKSPLQGIQLPLILKGSHFTIDSISFVGSLLGESGIPLLDTISNESGIVSVERVYKSGYALPPGTGTLVSIYLSIGDSLFQHTISIDTTRFVLDNGALHRFVLSDDSAVEFVPEFTPGIIKITP